MQQHLLNSLGLILIPTTNYRHSEGLDGDGSLVEGFGYGLGFQRGGQGGGKQVPTGGEQLSPCLRDALREFFPQQTVHGDQYSPVDDARFKSGIPFPTVGNIDAITLGLNIHYDPKRVSLNGGDSESLQTIVEEIAHTEQFLPVWANTQPSPKAVEYRGDFTVSHSQGVNSWVVHYAASAAKGFIKNGDSYKNDIEKGAKNKVFDILSPLTGRLRAEGKTDLCGYDILNINLERPRY